MNAKRVCLSLITILCLPAFSAFDPAFSARAQAKKVPPSPPVLQVGYVVITPYNPNNLAVFETFGEKGPNAEMPQAGVLSTDLMSSAMIFVSTSHKFSKDLGLAIVNPGSTDGTVTFTLHDSDAVTIATNSITLKAGAQTAQFVRQLFPKEPSVQGEFNGTVAISSTVPVAMVGLRFRGPNFSTVPVTATGPVSGVPGGAVILPQFAEGRGWASEIVFINIGSGPLTVRADFFGQDGKPMDVTLDGVTDHTFTTSAIPPGGVFILDPGDVSGDPF